VPKRHQLTFPRQPLQRFVLQHTFVSRQVVHHPAVKNAESCIDPAIQLRLLCKRGDLRVFADLQHAESGRGTHRRDRGQLAMRPVKSDQSAYVHIGQSVAVRQQKRVVLNVLGRFAECDRRSWSWRRSPPESRENRVPRARRLIANGSRPSQADRKIVVRCFVVQEIFFDHVAPITQAQHEFLEPVNGVAFHDVPQHGPSPISTIAFGRSTRSLPVIGSPRLRKE